MAGPQVPFAGLGFHHSVLACSAYGYLYSPPAAVWQSPYWRYLPASTTQLVAKLDELGVDAVWMNHWDGTPLMFDRRDRISASNYFDLAVGHGIDRLPAATNRFRAAELPAYVFVTDESFVVIEEWLRSQNIPYAKRGRPELRGHSAAPPCRPIPGRGLSRL